MNQDKNRIKVLMLGPARSVLGGVSAVVNGYFDHGLQKYVDIQYLETMRDGSKIIKLVIAIRAYFYFIFHIGKYDVVHAHMATDPSFTRKSIFLRCAVKRHKKIIIHQHGGDFYNFYYQQSSNKKRQKIQRVFSWADKVIVLTDGWKDFFSNEICEKDKICVIKNGVSLPPDYRKDYSEKKVLFLGRIEKEKGVEELLQAFSIVIKQDPTIHLYLGGEGKNLEEMIELSKSFAISDNVHFLGWISKNKDALFMSCALFILPSWFEALPMSILEAMSYKLPVIASNVGGIPSIVCDGETGFLIKPNDYHAIVDSVLKIINAPEKMEMMGTKGRTVVQREYNIDNTIATLVDLYHNICKDD